MEIKILELFGGIGACTKAFKRLGIPHKVVDYVEIDKYAVASYNAINGTNFEPQDICNWDKDIKVDLIMHGSPCQDFSIVGQGKGGDKDSGTRSSLMYETIRIVEKLRPKYVIWENVKNLLSKKHIHNFNAYLETLEQLGYTNYYQVLNAKDYGIPQNRERVFTVSVRMDVLFEYYMKFKEKNGITYAKPYFEFPPKQELKLKLKDMLEDEVDEKYYLSERMVNFFYKNEQIQKAKGNGFRFNVSDGMDDNYIGKKYNNFIEKHGYIPEMFNPYNESEIKEIAPTQTTNCGSTGCSATVLLKSKCKRLESLVEKTEFEKGKVLNLDLYNQTTNENISQCLTEPHHNTQRLFDGDRIRKLTPCECWLLMGFDKSDFEKADKVNSNTQLYKQAGNSIVVNVLEAILTNLLLETNQDIPKGQTTIFDYEV